MEYAKLVGKGEELFGIEEEMKKRERVIMKELHHIEDIITGNPKMAEDLIRDLNQLLFSETNVFATFLKGRISFELKHWKKSKELLEETLNGLDECPDLEESNLHSICLNDLGRLSFYDSDYNTALSYTENAIKVFNDNGKRIYYKPYLYLNKVIYLEKLERDEEACRVLEYLYTHIDKFRNNLGVVIQIHEQFANLLLKSGSPIKAKEHAEEGLQKAWDNRENRRLFS